MYDELDRDLEEYPACEIYTETGECLSLDHGHCEDCQVRVKPHRVWCGQCNPPDAIEERYAGNRQTMIDDARDSGDWSVIERMGGKK
jgi:hypothetical protein